MLRTSASTANASTIELATKLGIKIQKNLAISETIPIQRMSLNWLPHLSTTSELPSCVAKLPIPRMINSRLIKFRTFEIAFVRF